MHIADFGTGGGHWALSLAKLTGPGGIVYAIDVQTEALEAVRSQAETAGIHHIESIRADVERPRGSGLADTAIDFVLIANILFQTDKKNAVIKEAWRILKPRGYTAVIDWDEGGSDTGPPLPYRVPRKEVEHLLIQEGFVFDKEFSAGSHHYGMLFKKTDGGK